MQTVCSEASEQTPLKGFGGDAERPKNWQEADAKGWPAPVYDSEEVRIQCQRGFLRKVYGILTLQLATTVGLCWLVMSHPAINTWVLTNRWLLIVSFVASMGLMVGLFIKKNSFPINLYLLAAFTLVESLTVATVCAHYEAHGVGYLVGIAWGVTLAIFIGLTLLVTCTNIDFSFMGMFLPATLMGFMLFSLVSLIFGFHLGWAFAFFGALLFSAFIIYDTYMIMNRMGTDDYVIACVELYLDLINLFLMILEIFGGNK